MSNNGTGIKEGGECLVGGFKEAVSSLYAYNPKDTQFAPLFLYHVIGCFSFGMIINNLK